MPEEPEMVRRTCLFSGWVQGVGFRYSVVREAKPFAVTGYVRNLSDGRVELVAEADSAELDRFQSAVAKAMRAHITDVEVRDAPATGEFTTFGIHY